MDRFYTHTPTSGVAKFGRGQAFYRATVWRDGKRIAYTKGKTNTQEQIDAFLAEHWPYDMKWYKVEAWEATYKLEIKKYWGNMHETSKLAQSPGL